MTAKTELDVLLTDDGRLGRAAAVAIMATDPALTDALRALRHDRATARA